MPEIDLTKDELETLAAVLKTYLSDLRMEISHTDSMDFRELLKKRKEIIQKAINSMESAAGTLALDES